MDPKFNEQCAKQMAEDIERLARIGREWEHNNSLEKWFPFTAEELAKLRAENADLRAEIARLDDVVIRQQELEEFMKAAAERENQKDWHRCETCQQEGTVHIKMIGCYLCQSCLEKVNARIKEMGDAQIATE